MIKPGRHAIDPQGRRVYVVDVKPDPSGNRAVDMVRVKLAGPYGAHVDLPRSALVADETTNEQK